MSKVFISYKHTIDGVETRDSHMAAELYNKLTDAGIDTFFSKVTLSERGADKFKKEIDKELDECSILIVVGTTLENVNSNWVEYEWDGFSTDLLNGKIGKIFTYVDNINIHELARPLRTAEGFDKNKDSIDTIVDFVKNGLSNIEKEKADKVAELEGKREIERIESKCAQIADAYYERFKSVVLTDRSDRINHSLIDVFSFPNFENGKKLCMSKRNNYYVCAPNGYGKSTLLQSLLIATNASCNISNKERLSQLQEFYGIEDRWLTLLIDLKDIKTLTELKTEKNLYKWLLTASGIEGWNGFKIKSDEFKKLIDYYNNNNKLMIIIDSIDETSHDHVNEIDRDDVYSKIKELNSSEGICPNAQIIIASRPMIKAEDWLPFEQISIKSLESDRDKVENIIDRYAPMYKDELLAYIYSDLYLEHLIVTPQLLTELISHYLNNKYNDEAGMRMKVVGKYNVIMAIIKKTMTRYRNRDNIEYLEKKYEHIYEIFAYISLFTDVSNNDFARFRELILNNELNNSDKRKKPISIDDIVEVYEHICLLNTNMSDIEFLAPKVLQSYYLAGYMNKYYSNVFKDGDVESKNKWKMIESVLRNKYGSSECLYDMMVFFFGNIHEGIYRVGGYDPDSPAYNAWIDYVVFKWNSERTSETDKSLLADRLKYLLASDFVKDSCFDKRLKYDDDLSENEKQLKIILSEIINSK